ncbi:MAG: MtnX-like HAD-IB family phosphatase [Candidatus Omnitrophica bacterium]|nr:MtnX-like HAD-IB family phosphatase [Candidatus Omnitrophota bacterium]
MKKAIVITDFDGTITQKDTLVGILDKFAGPKWLKIAALVRSGRLGTKIGLKKEMALCRVTKKEYIDFLNTDVKIDPTFKNFLRFCEKNKLKVIVVSGGFGLNIEVVFKKFGIPRLPYYANIIQFKGNIVKLKYPYTHKACKTCGHCKAPYIKRFKDKGYFTIYAGDSVTDRCPAKVADLVFAKHHLAEYCGEKGIPFVPYTTFGQIKKRLISKALLFHS